MPHEQQTAGAKLNPATAATGSANKGASGSKRSSAGRETIELPRQVKRRGVERIGALFTYPVAAYDLVRLRNLLHAPPRGKPEPLPLFA